MENKSTLVDTVELTLGCVMLFSDGEVRISCMFPNSGKNGTVYLSKKDADKVAAALASRSWKKSKNKYQQIEVTEKENNLG